MTQLVIANATVLGSNVTCSLLGNASISRTGGTSASASSGGGGWQVVDRARQKAATEWLDYYPWVMTCTCLLDLAVQGGTSVSLDSIEGWISALESFEMPVPGSQPPLPPILTLTGPVPHTDLFWVCSKLDFAGGDTGQIRNAAGERTQQGFTIQFTEYSPSTAIFSTVASPAQIAAQNTGTAAGQTTLTGAATYTVIAGDTLQSIAVSQLGNVALWTQIALVNNLSASAILTPGQQLIMPTQS